MKASETTGRKTAQQRHDAACSGSQIARHTSLTPASFGGIAVLLLMVGFITACSSGFDSLQTTSGGDARSAKTAPREKILLEGVRFKPDGSGVRPNAQPILDEATELLKSHPDMKVYVETYCDPIGGKQLNFRLSQQRAAIVSAYLENHGIASDRVIARGFGATHFIARNDTADGRAQNRRIELILSE